jgi:hypothetical protein
MLTKLPKSSFVLPPPIREGLAFIAREHGQFVKGHGFTGRPNMTWAICHLVERELRRIARKRS